ncbi:MAG: pyridine nucleotide-disulfide oxidoreductase [Alteromonadaceae bacterium]|uniref:FAD-dependent oxidoreductase n=1 Tax=Paraglaciecola chathamensis TaxID=368405 RepID=UPI000C4D246F|nr:bifunctional TVP38/TMEM64 family protein/FAD-dependent oxidoreductase [Paraglaciecola agarilytica]MBN24651.1 pyridine nucleotide-disulfide oxidoreductase [Alteromonadaceae bacterium]|tara:strand:- start:62576 stop:64717 length:2142 start_codon:yes stop_codon:yes gene_type:complete
MNSTRIILVAIIVALIASFFVLDLNQYLTLESLKSNQQDLAQYIEANWLIAFIGYLVIYAAATALSVPGAAILTLGAGALFGFGWGLLLASFASSIGATLAFLASRFLLRDWVKNTFSKKLESIDKGVEKDGAFYLLSLRLVPIFPFFIINLVMGVTSIKTWTYYWVSQLGMLIGTAVYVNAGTQLVEINQLSDIISTDLILSFVLLGIFPILAKFILSALQQRRVYKGWKKPKKFDRNLVVIGAGSAGLVTAYIAAAIKSKVTLVERHKMGGDCLNTGCVPSKSILHASKLAHIHHTSQNAGVTYEAPKIDFKAVMNKVHSVIKSIEPHDSVERYESLGVNVSIGSATIVSPWQVDIQTENGVESLTTRNIVIATGARAFVPDIPGLKDIDYLTADNLWEITEQPKRMIVLGGGPIGCELSQAFGRLGTHVTQIERGDQVLSKEDPDAAKHLQTQLEKDGIDLRLNTSAMAVETTSEGNVLVVEFEGKEERIPFDKILVAVGRQANLTGFGLEDLGIETDRTVITNDFLQTKYPNILAAGDVAGPYQFTHTASHQAWYAAVNALFRPFKTFKVDYSVIPWATFAEPEIATVGLNETSAKQQGIDFEVTRYDIGGLDRALADDHARGFVKVITKPGKDKILGATIVGANAGELLAEFVLAMKHGLGLNKILGTIHIYPTMAEANKNVAGNWKKDHAPQKVLDFVERFHTWRRK